MLLSLPRASQVALLTKNPPANAEDIRDVYLIPGLGRSSGGGHGKPLQYFCLESPTGRGACQATVPSMGLQRVGYNWSDLACGHVPSFPLFLPSSHLGGAVPLGQVLANKSRSKGSIRLALRSASSFSCSCLWSCIFYGSPREGYSEGASSPSSMSPFFCHHGSYHDSTQGNRRLTPRPARWPGAAFLSILHQPAPQTVERQLQTPPHTPPQAHWQWSSRGWALKSSVLGSF